ncbi:MAG: hypothetical protein LBE92_10335 [Chryseobacterium sp.]|jgi:hypothetical protein|uniref:hypothetical protein n=1 Tax=Chryseobacterium sp. TaxID=1871047 RepID=UPI0028277B69|nr:hypothetical protein [Chryseobacterium sp.]MDR2236513.1 hypothetical protein [Chryseobacterium sp.]
MKNTYLLIPCVIAALFTSKVSAQVKGNQILGNSSINLSTAFFDASSSTLWNGASPAATNVGKGFIFPRADLRSLVLTNNGTYLASNNPNRFDGIIVYNTATGTTPSTGSGIGNQAVVPGFYYFSNPGTPTSPATGQWIPLGGAPIDPKVNVVTTGDTVTNTLINNVPIYARKGSFTVNGTTTAATPATGNAVIIPTAGSLYRITIFQAGTNNVYANSVYSYDKATGNFVTGAPSMSVVYPAGTYDYVVEFTKP